MNRYGLMAAGVAMTVALFGGAYWAGTAVASPPPVARVPSVPVQTLASHGAKRGGLRCLDARVLRVLTRDTARALHLSPRTFRQDLARGKNPAMLAVSEGSTATALETTVTTELSARVKNAEAAGRISAARATALEARLAVRVDHFVTMPPARLRLHARWQVRVRARRMLLRDASRSLHMTPSALRTDLREGESLATIASAHGSSAAALESALIADVRSVLAHAVASGHLRAARAARIEKILPARIDRLVTATPRASAHPTPRPAAPNVS